MRGTIAGLDPRPSVAIIGSGLASGLLASNLATWAKVTVYERGSATPAHPDRPVASGHPLGLYPSFSYGLGGTTNLWRGSLLAMCKDEYKEDWPTDVRNDLERYQPRVVQILYGARACSAWSAHRPKNAEAERFIDVILKARSPFRVSNSNLFANAEVRLNHYVDCVDEFAGRVFVCARQRSELRSPFDAVVICAGGLNSPLILKRSQMGNKLVGKNLTDHPMGFVAKLTRKAEWPGFSLFKGTDYVKPVAKVVDARTGLWSTFMLVPTENSIIDSDPYSETFEPREISPGILRYGKRLPKLLDREYRALVLSRLLRRPHLGTHAFVLAFSEQEAWGQGSVIENDKGSLCIDWNVSDKVVSAIERSLCKLAKWLDADLHLATGDLRTRLWSAAHHSGGCRISESPSSGVVDSNLRVFGTQRVFVCDGSVLPSTGASNTGLAIGSLSLRLATHLKLHFGCAASDAAEHSIARAD